MLRDFLCAKNNEISVAMLIVILSIIMIVLLNLGCYLGYQFTL